MDDYTGVVNILYVLWMLMGNAIWFAYTYNVVLIFSDLLILKLKIHSTEYGGNVFSKQKFSWVY